MLCLVDVGKDGGLGRLMNGDADGLVPLGESRPKSGSRLATCLL